MFLVQVVPHGINIFTDIFHLLLIKGGYGPGARSVQVSIPIHWFGLLTILL
jgi:hypothetical protein